MHFAYSKVATVCSGLAESSATDWSPRAVLSAHTKRYSELWIFDESCALSVPLHGWWSLIFPPSLFHRTRRVQIYSTMALNFKLNLSGESDWNGRRNKHRRLDLFCWDINQKSMTWNSDELFCFKWNSILLLLRNEGLGQIWVPFLVYLVVVWVNTRDF